MADDLKKSDNYQCIRAMSCIFVCFNHFEFFNNRAFGMCGVEYFVIMSGLLTALNAERHKRLRKNYLLSKITKLMPLYWIVTLLIFIAGCCCPRLFSSLSFSFSDLLYSMLIVPGHAFYVYPGWTLPVFFVFYLIYYLADKYTSNRDLFASLFVILFVVAGIVSRQFCPDNIFGAYSNCLLLEFVYGIALFHVMKKKRHSINVIFLITALVLFFNYEQYLGIRYIVPAILTCISIYYADLQRIRNKAILKLLKRIGDSSYVIYIVQPLIIRPCDKLMSLFIGDSYGIPYFAGVLISVAICVSLCVLITPYLRRMRLV